ncbi:MAG: hypothetical protein LBR40_00410 [Bacilli bacterium]|jgi:hypothetical protein|nr:hypothetical protein [Bacilli bacterium]
MKKILLCMMLAFSLVLSGCGGDNRLSKDAYIDKITTLNQDVIDIANSVYYSTDATKIKEASAKMKSIVKEMIALKGPKNMQTKEDALDKTLNEYLTLFDDAVKMRVDKTMTYDEYMKKATQVDNDFAKAYEAYN